MTAEEAEKLIAVLKSNGVQHYKAGDVELTFAEPQRVRLPRAQNSTLPADAVLADPVAEG